MSYYCTDCKSDSYPCECAMTTNANVQSVEEAYRRMLDGEVFLWPDGKWQFFYKDGGFISEHLITGDIECVSTMDYMFLGELMAVSPRAHPAEREGE